MAQEALRDVLTHKPATKKAMNIDPWANGSDAAGYSVEDGHFVGATLARGALTNAVLAISYLMKQKVIFVTVNEDVVGDLPQGVDTDDHVKTAAFLAQLIGAVPVDPTQPDYMLTNVPSTTMTESLFRETVLSMIMPESLKVWPLLFGSGRDGTSNSLLSETGRVKDKTSTAAQLFQHQHDGLNKTIAAFTQLLNGQNEHMMGIALRAEPANAICSYLRK